MAIKKFKFIKKNANAKINLGLQVINKRIDGYHNINTVFYPIFLLDNIDFIVSDKFDIINNNCDIPIKDNIMFKMWNIINTKYKIEPITISITKNIPIGAGLGGGSSDAAKTLLAINELFELNLSEKEMHQFCLQVGSDVAYFLQSHSVAVASSRGENLNYINFSKRFNLLLVNPGINISTPKAYNSLKKDYIADNIIDYKEILEKIEPINYKNYIFNDFEFTLFKEYPEIENIKNTLYNQGAFFALMSGSGSSVYAFFENKELALNAASKFPDSFVYVE